MYNIGDLVMKNHTGICRVEAVAPMEGGGQRLYYTLVPLSDGHSRFYVPTQPEPAGIRPVLTEEEGWVLLREIPGLAPIQIENEKQREQLYREILRSNDPRSLAAIVKMLYLREQERAAQGKKPAAMDKSYFQLAEKLLNSELALALGRQESEIPELIRESLENA